MKSHIKIVSLFVLLAFSQVLIAQSELLVLSAQDDQSIPEVLISVVSNDQNYKTLVSDINGKAILNSDEYPIVIQINHAAYNPIIDTLYEKGTYVYKLSPAVNQLDEVIITGYLVEYRKQDAPREVLILTAKEIEALQARTLKEAIKLMPGLNLRNDAGTSGSYAELLGIGGNNVKILLDGVVISGRTGQEFDISQISLDNIERIEITEGPMSVEYGSNALAGVIHLISKNQESDAVNIQLNLSEESMGNEYNNRGGIHDWKLNMSIPLNKNLNWQVGGGRRLSGGVQVVSEGRVMDWDPRTQYTAHSNLAFSKNKLSLQFNGSFLHDKINNDGAINSVINPQALDDEYITQRWVQSVVAKWVNPKSIYNLQASYNDYKREKHTLINDFSGADPEYAIFNGAQDTSTLKSIDLRGNWMIQFLKNAHSNTGFEWRNENASGGRIEDANANDEEFSLFNSSEIKLDFLTIRSGLRWSHSNRFADALLPSLHFLKKINRFTFRTGYAKGYRLPSLRELYFDFNDQNHNIRGNTDLNPETSDYTFISIHYQPTISGFIGNLESSIRVYHSKFQELIDYAQSPIDPMEVTLLNTHQFTTKGINATQSMASDRWNLLIQMNYSQNQYIDDIAMRNNNFAASTAFSYRIHPRITLNANAIFKGQHSQLINDFTAGEDEVAVAFVKPYQLIDANITYSISENLKITTGIRNALNVKTVKTTGGGIHGLAKDELIAYGRSALLNLKWNFKIKPNSK